MPAMTKKKSARPSYGMNGSMLNQVISHRMNSTAKIIAMESRTAPHLMTAVRVTNAL